MILVEPESCIPQELFVSVYRITKWGDYADGSEIPEILYSRCLKGKNVTGTFGEPLNGPEKRKEDWVKHRSEDRMGLNEEHDWNPGAMIFKCPKCEALCPVGSTRCINHSCYVMYCYGGTEEEPSAGLIGALSRSGAGMVAKAIAVSGANPREATPSGPIQADVEEVESAMLQEAMDLVKRVVGTRGTKTESVHTGFVNAAVNNARYIRAWASYDEDKKRSMAAEGYNRAIKATIIRRPDGSRWTYRYGVDPSPTMEDILSIYPEGSIYRTYEREQMELGLEIYEKYFSKGISTVPADDNKEMIKKSMLKIFNKEKPTYSIKRSPPWPKWRHYLYTVQIVLLEAPK